MARTRKSKIKPANIQGGRFIRNPDTGDLVRATDQVGYGAAMQAEPETQTEVKSETSAKPNEDK